MPYAAAISAGATLVGGLLGQSASKKAREQEVRMFYENREWNQPEHVRYRAEQAGFNPLLFIGPGVGQSAAPNISGGGQNYLGSAIADAGMILADGLSRRKESQKVSQLEAQNKKLAEQVQSLTLRPKVGGIYANRQATPTLRQALGVPNGVSASSSQSAFGTGGVSDDSNTPSAGLAPLAKREAVDLRREVENSPVKTHSGVMVVDNPYVGRLRFPTLDGDEVLQWYDYPTLIGGAAVNKVFDFGYGRGQAKFGQEVAKSKADGRPVVRMGDGKYYARQPDPEIDGGIYLRSPKIPPRERPYRGRTYKPPTKRGPDGNFR